MALAYGRSERPDAFLQIVRELKDEHRAAKAAGDEERVAELEVIGPALQNEMHLQGFCGAPIDNILVLIQDEIRSVAEEKDLDLIVGEVIFQAPGVELVDVTVDLAEGMKQSHPREARFALEKASKATNDPPLQMYIGKLLWNMRLKETEQGGIRE